MSLTAWHSPEAGARSSGAIDPCFWVLRWPAERRCASVALLNEGKSPDGEGKLPPEDSGIFPATRWSLILEAQESTTTSSGNALAQLCELYWYPIYCFIRSRGFSPEDSEDLCQSFFQRMLSRKLFERAEAGKGRLRSFLLHALKDHLVDSRRWNLAQKRGGGMKQISLDQGAFENRFQLERVDDVSPDTLFDRTWACTVMDRGLKKLEEAYTVEGKGDLFRMLQLHMSGNNADGYGELAQQLNMNPNSVRVAVHRMRKRFRAILKGDIKETLNEREDVEEEIRYLLGLFSP